MRTCSHRPRASARLSWALSALALALAAAGTGAEGAFAEGCPGSGPGPCPYATAQIIGQRAEGVLRFPEAVAVDTQGNVYVADQLSYVVQKFTANGTFETEWGSYGGGHSQFGPIGGLATDAGGNVYVVDSSHNRIEKFDSNGTFITAWGHTGSELGQFRFFSSQNPTQPPGGGIAVAATTCTSPTAGTTASSASTSRAENRCSGAPTATARGTSPTRAASRRTPAR